MLDKMSLALILPFLLLALLLDPLPANAGIGAPEQVMIDDPAVGKGAFTAQLLLPEGSGPFPAILALHGCGGLITRTGIRQSRETDWAERFLAAGYAVMFPDSFNARGYREICTVKDRKITPADRAQDALAAASWLTRHPAIDPDRLALLGWSHGAMSVLWTIRAGFGPSPSPFRTAVAFYPGCIEIARQPAWTPATPLTILIGAADDWTLAAPCRRLGERESFRVIEYPDAYHGFDAPDTPVRIRQNIASLRSGQAHVGTNPAARSAAIVEVMTLLEAALQPR